MELTDAQIRTIALCDGGGYQDDDNADWEFKDAALLKFARALLAAAPAQAEPVAAAAPGAVQEPNVARPSYEQWAALCETHYPLHAFDCAACLAWATK
jgi:hypothetical protein